VDGGKAFGAHSIRAGGGGGDLPVVWPSNSNPSFGHQPRFAALGIDTTSTDHFTRSTVVPDDKKGRVVSH